jgi:hypothetical protein
MQRDVGARDGGKKKALQAPTKMSRASSSSDTLPP